MTKNDGSVSAGAGTLLIGTLAVAGSIVGCIPGNAAALAVIAVLFLGAIGYTHWHSQYRPYSDVPTVLTIGMFACLAAALCMTGARFIITTPGAALVALWLYMLIATGFMISRCCLGWHIGAAAAVLTSFIATGLFVQSFYGAGPEWLAALIVAFGLWWGADDWRRANGLALNE